MESTPPTSPNADRGTSRQKYRDRERERPGGYDTGGQEMTKINFRSHGRSIKGIIHRGAPTAVRTGQFTKSDLVTQSNAVSIPSKLETVLYKEDREYMGFGSHALRFDETRDENPGPGAYQYPKEFGKIMDSDSFGKRGTGGFASKSRRFRPQGVAGVPIPGPGAYEQVKPQPKTLFSNQSPVFVSPNIFPKRDKGSVPGPGAYTHAEMTTNTSNNVCASSFKKVRRSKKERSALEEPGPTTYFREPIKMKIPGGGSSAFTHPSKRRYLSVHPDLPLPRRHLTDPEGAFVRQCGGATDQIPGPGTYDVDIPDNVTFNAKGSSFFQHHSTTRVKPVHIYPGPGNYDAPILNRTNAPTIRSAFMSVVDRQPAVVKDAPGPAFYKVVPPIDKPSFHLNVNKRWI